MDRETFMGMTPHEFSYYQRAHEKIYIREHNLMMKQAFLTAKFTNYNEKKPLKLIDYLLDIDSNKKKVVSSDEEANQQLANFLNASKSKMGPRIKPKNVNAE